jgi:hypothetical protein
MTLHEKENRGFAKRIQLAGVRNFSYHRKLMDRFIQGL